MTAAPRSTATLRVHFDFPPGADAPIWAYEAVSLPEAVSLGDAGPGSIHIHEGFADYPLRIVLRPAEEGPVWEFCGVAVGTQSWQFYDLPKATERAPEVSYFVLKGTFESQKELWIDIEQGDGDTYAYLVGVSYDGNDYWDTDPRIENDPRPTEPPDLDGCLAKVFGLLFGWLRRER